MFRTTKNTGYIKNSKVKMNRIKILHNHFLQELEKSNANKTPDAPVAVVIKAGHDWNGMFSAAPAQSLILQIAQTHRIAMKTIEDARQFGQAIREGCSKLGKDASLVLVMAHGYPDRLQFGREVPWYKFWRVSFYQKKYMLPEDFTRLSPVAKIVLFSCNSGLGMAQSLSNISNRTVHAPLGDLWDTKTCLQNWPDQEIKLVTYNEKNEQHMWAFTPNKSPTLVSSAGIFSTENKESFSSMTDHIKNAASKGDANAQWKLGMLHLLGIGTCCKSEKEATHWLWLAAKQGVPQAQFEFGNMTLIGRGDLKQSDRQAGQWFFRSASQEFPPALFQMGVAYLNGQYGFAQSDEKAVKFFTLAAKKGVPQALFNLAVLYEHGKGVKRSLNYAKRLYKIAEGLGITGSKERLANLINHPSDNWAILWIKLHALVNFLTRLAH